MAEPEEVLRDSPVDFDSAVAYALHPEMRRLILLYVVGVLLVSVGLSLFVDPAVGATAQALVWQAIGLVLTVVGATFLFGGLVGAAFKLVADANILATTQ